MRPPARARFAGRAALLVSSASRLLRLGSGSVIGGRVGLILDPELLGSLALGRTVALVSGTNGKTTTTRLLSAALGGPQRVATSTAGSNLPSGLATALAGSDPGSPAVLEVDEGYLATVADAVNPAAIALLNLSRDQLDRVSEVRMIAARWKVALAGREGTAVVANVDDPLVVWAASAAPKVVWVAAGQLWHADSIGCPACDGHIVFADAGPESGSRDGGSEGGGGPGERSNDERDDCRSDGDWWCTCGFRRPTPDAWLRGDQLHTSDGHRLQLRLSLPGRCNLANAAIALECAGFLSVDIAQALEAISAVDHVEGRFATVGYEGTAVRLLLAKNPAGWTELLDLLRGRSGPIVIGINAHIADGHDPSWLWDVPFEQLNGRRVVATGERCLDLAVRLRHAGAEHLVIPDQRQAILAAGSEDVDYVGNYTAFQELRRALARGGSRRQENRSLSNSRPAAGSGSPPSGGGRGWGPDRAAEGAKTRRNDGVSALRVVVVHPDLLGTYGDGGNGRVLVDRAQWRGIDAELVMALSDTALPAGADVYCLGGGEDGPQVQSAKRLADGTLQRAAEAGAAVLAVCAGYQVVGRSFPDALGAIRPGAGLLDVATVKGPSKRAVGELLAEPLEHPQQRDALGTRARLGRLTGFENHGGVTQLGDRVRPLARVIAGVGNGTGDGTEGAVSGRIIGTYMHGPVLARNPALADLLLEMVTGASLDPLDDAEEEALRAERFAAVRARVSV